MGESAGVTRILLKHFFRRFFDNDTVQLEGDTLISVVRAACVVAVPGLMYAFFLQNAYSHPARSTWGAIEDQYFFILVSFIVMGAVAVFEWDMLFPDRLDFLVLSPLPLKARQLLAAKSAALLAFFTIFLASCNLLGTAILPLLSKGFPFRQMYAQGAAVLMAGSFAALSILALSGVLLCTLGPTRSRLVSPVLQMILVAGLVLLLLEYFKTIDSLPALLSNPAGIARWMPPFWFLGMYQWLFHGSDAPAFARSFMHRGTEGIFIALFVVLTTYPLAWIRMRRAAFEGSTRQGECPSPTWAALFNVLVRRPGERAVFHFIGQTISRNSRYQVYLSMYGGLGLAMATACATTLRLNGAGTPTALSEKGLHAVLPLLLFWVIVGLRTAFAFPQNLAAGWVFRVHGVSSIECADAARKWALLCGFCVMLVVLGLLFTAHWDRFHLFVQIVFGLCLCVLLTDGVFLFAHRVPFNQPRMPGSTSLPFLLTMYVGIFPLFILGVVALQLAMERHIAQLLFLTAGTAMLHAGLLVWRKGSNDMPEEVEGYEGEFQILGLG